MSVISVRGATEHNLKNVSVNIVKEKLVAFTGISGSGKSSLVFDTIYAESFRRFLGASNLPGFVLGSSLEVRHSRPRVLSITGLPPALGLSQRQGVASKLSTVGTVCGVTNLFRVYFAVFGDVYCRSCDISLRPTPVGDVLPLVLKNFSEQQVTVVSPIAEKRRGAFSDEIEKFRQLGYSRLRVNGVVHDLQDEKTFPQIDSKKLNTIELVVDKILVAPEKLRRIERAISEAVSQGAGVVKVEGANRVETFNTHSTCPQCGESSPKLDARHFSHSSLGKCSTCSGTGASNENIWADISPCGSCGGSRLLPDLPLVRVCGKTFPNIMEMKVSELHSFVNAFLLEHASQDKARLKVASEILRLCATLCEVGVQHLVVGRAASSLSPGDLQRIRLATMLSNRLSGALYVLDEPCQGLTAQEVRAFVEVVRKRVNEGSSVVVVEHHPVFLAECDVVHTLGPGAGIHGGKIIETVEPRKSVRDIPVYEPKNSQKNGSEHSFLLFNNFSVRGVRREATSIVQREINLLRGPTGSGKLSFLELALEPVLEMLRESKNPTVSFCEKIHGENVLVKSVQIVKPGSITRTSRRTVAAALDILPLLRSLFAQLPQSQLLGFTEMSFSWNSVQGRCENCDGKGVVEIKQRYGAPVDVECDACLGAKLQPRSLVPRFKGKNFFEIMQLTVEEAREFFANIRGIESRLSGACDFGLGYVSLAQSMDTLSGGELQRLLLTMELRRSSLEGAWFLLVHSGTGLHAPDIDVLGKLMGQMCAKGATFVMLENREEFLQYAGNVIDFQ